ncbi:hypothetical protein BHM03_00012115 [Ensete ventricosum]|nr:hypothetical protein BHM03_00012115 [Ensete ventricosum]
MRLNHVESFYVFLLRCRSEGNEEEGQPGMASPPARGRPTTVRPPAWGDRPQGQQSASGRLTAGAAPAGRPPAGRSTSRYQWPVRKGLLIHGEATGTAPARGQPVEERRP